MTNVQATNALTSFAPPVIQTKYSRQELYLKRVDLFIKSSTECKKIVDYMVREMYNGAEMYGIDHFIDDPKNWPYIRDFVGLMRQAGGIRVGIAYSNKNAVGKLAAFNASPIHTVNQTQIDNQISEIEPWVSSSGVTWSDFFNTLEYVQKVGYSAKPRLEVRSYEGWPQKPTASQEGNNVRGTILGVDVVGLHVYTYGQPAYSYIRSRLMEFAKQAVLCGYTPLKKLPVIPILSAEPDFSGPWFKKYHPVLAMDDLVNRFNADSFPNKDVLAFDLGYLMFKSTDIMAVRP